MSIDRILLLAVFFTPLAAAAATCCPTCRRPSDGMIWGSVLGFPGSIVRLDPGANPPATALAEIYELPWNNPKAPVQGFSRRGLDIDRHGVVWTVTSSGHFASFDRRKCKDPLNGPAATGQHCPEGWTLYPMPAVARRVGFRQRGRQLL